MDFSSIDKMTYGNLEEDAELMAELLALTGEEQPETRQPSSSGGPRGSVAPPPPTRTRGKVPAAAGAGIDPHVLEAALADQPDDVVVEDDDELMGELAQIIDEEQPPAVPHRNAPPVPARQEAPPPLPARQSSVTAPVQQHAPAPTVPPRPVADVKATISGGADDQLSHLRALHAFYTKLKTDASNDTSGTSAAKIRRHQRAIDTLNGLVRKAERGVEIDPSDIPPAPPGFSGGSAPSQFQPVVKYADVPQPSHHGVGSVLRDAARTETTEVQRHPEESAAKRSSSSTPSSSAAVQQAPKMEEIRSILVRRKNKFIENAKAAKAAEDKASVVQFVTMSKLFDQAISGLSAATAEELDLSEVPPSPPPYRKKVEPKTFVEGLESRLVIYREMTEKAKQDGDSRRARMYGRSVEQYTEALRDARAGRAVDASSLPSRPDMPPLPPPGAASKAQHGPAPGVRPPPAVGPLAPSGTSGSRNESQLQFLLARQAEFKKAAIDAKQKGNLDLARKYLVDAKGFEKMISASRSGLPIDIRAAPLPPSSQTAPQTLQPRIAPSSTSVSGVEGRGEVLSMLEKGLIEQIQLADNNRMRFTRLGDVGKVKLFEQWAKTSKQDLMLVREVAKQGYKLPKFHYENRHIPSADLFPDLAEDVFELTLIAARDVPLPSGYEPHHANLYVRYTFPYPTDSSQTGKTKYVAGSTSPEFNEVVILQVGGRKARGQKLQRTLKRTPLKLEVFQKGGFMRSDKLQGTCEWKIDGMESKAELEESLPLREGRKAVGGLLTVRLRAREPIGDTRLAVTSHKWIILDN